MEFSSIMSSFGYHAAIWLISFSFLICFLCTCLFLFSLFFSSDYHVRVWDTKLNRTWASRSTRSSERNSFEPSPFNVLSAERPQRRKWFLLSFTFKEGSPEEGTFNWALGDEWGSACTRKGGGVVLCAESRAEGQWKASRVNECLLKLSSLLHIEGALLSIRNFSRGTKGSTLLISWSLP